MLPDTPLLHSDGTVSRNHWYLLYRHVSGEVVVFCFPRRLLIGECIVQGQAMLGAEWTHLDINDPTYDGRHSAEEIARWSTPHQPRLTRPCGVRQAPPPIP